MPRSITTSVAASSGRNKGVLMVALLLGILAFVLMFAFLKSKGGDGTGQLRDQVSVGNGAETVLVATQDIPVGTKITDAMVKTQTLPALALLEGRFSRSDDALDKVATAPIFTGEQLTSNKISTDIGQTTIAFKVEEGRRGMGIMVPHEAWIVGGLPQPGDRIDIIGVVYMEKTDPLTGDKVPDLLGGIIVQNVEVLAMGQVLVPRLPNTDLSAAQTAGSESPSNTAAGNKDTKEGTYETKISVTLSLTPEEAAKVAMIDAMDDDAGQYRLVVRHKGDSIPVAGTLTWSLQDLFVLNKK